MFRLHGSEIDVAFLAFLDVDVQCEEACFSARRDADQSFRIAAPPFTDNAFVDARSI
ncbi:hypothetical protein D3C87_1813910 [compost metagenome]